MKILTTGGKGYLCSNLCNAIPDEYEHLLCDVRRLDDIPIPEHDSILHFACPSDQDGFQDNKRLVTTIIDGTRNLVNISNKFGSKLIFASSKSVERDPEKYASYIDMYADLKLAMEHYIRAVCKSYIILRIPRVYSPCRDKGLMKRIKGDDIPLHDMNNIVEYITLDDFVGQTKLMLHRENVTCNYVITKKETIRDITRWVNKAV